MKGRRKRSWRRRKKKRSDFWEEKQRDKAYGRLSKGMVDTVISSERTGSR